MEAYKLCNATFGLDAWPVNIESEDELAHIMYLIEERVDDDEFTTFWTGAKFDTGSNKFVWDGKEPLESFVPWATDEPSQSLPTSRLVMKKTADDPNTWEMFATDEGSKFGFICEVRSILSITNFPFLRIQCDNKCNFLRSPHEIKPTLPHATNPMT